MQGLKFEEHFIYLGFFFCESVCIHDMQCVNPCVHHVHMYMNAHTWVYIFAHRSQRIVYVLLQVLPSFLLIRQHLLLAEARLAEGIHAEVGICRLLSTVASSFHPLPSSDQSSTASARNFQTSWLALSPLAALVARRPRYPSTRHSDLRIRVII